jgi:hypothetical protein
VRGVVRGVSGGGVVPDDGVMGRGLDNGDFEHGG